MQWLRLGCVISLHSMDEGSRVDACSAVGSPFMRAEYVCTLAPMPRLRISATSSMARRSCWFAPHWAMHVVYLPGESMAEKAPHAKQRISSLRTWPAA